LKVLGDAIPEAVRELLRDRIESIAQLETLLLLYRTAPAVWNAEMVAAELRIQRNAAAEQLELLRNVGLIAATDPELSGYWFAMPDPELRKAVDALATCYADRRVTVIALVYSKPDRARVFADAFRLRKEETDG
jgi:hypothetical protein